MPKKKLEERVSRFQDGSWLRLLEESQTSEAQVHQASARTRRNQGDSVEKRANKALTLVQMGELSAAGFIGRSRSGTRNVDDVEGVDQPRTPTTFPTASVESRDYAQ